MIREILKEKTSYLHTELESKMYTNELMQGSLSKSQYASLLHVNYKAYTQIEEIINKQLPISIKEEIDWETRTKIDALRNDLENLGENIEKTTISLSLTNCTIPMLLGMLYVAEGATLGGLIINKKLEENVNFGADFHSNFFNVYHNNTVKYWRTFCNVLESNININNIDVAIASAIATFQFYISLAENQFVK